MFAKIKDWSISFISIDKNEEDMIELSEIQLWIIQNWWTYKNWKFIEFKKSDDLIKVEKIREYKKIEQEAIKKRSEYLTAELLPEWVFKTMKLQKLEIERTDIEERYNEAINSLVSEYWEEILSELL